MPSIHLMTIMTLHDPMIFMEPTLVVLYIHGHVIFPRTPNNASHFTSFLCLLCQVAKMVLLFLTLAESVHHRQQKVSKHKDLKNILVYQQCLLLSHHP